MSQKSKNPIKIAPSILSADFAHLADEVKKAEDAGADEIHIDIMDGHFVRNLTMGPQIVSAIRRSTNLPLDVHLMIYDPFDFVERFVESGASNITFHLEATEEVEETLKYIRKCNVKAGLAFNPETTLSMIPKYLALCDRLLLMTVNPGFGGQELIEDVLDKVAFARDVCEKLSIMAGGISVNKTEASSHLPFDIQVDGGITLDNVGKCVEAGATTIVAGTSLYRAKDMKIALHTMREHAENAWKLKKKA